MKKIILAILVPMLLASCAQNITRGEQYAKMYEEKPTSIVIMPPINQTQHVEAKTIFTRQCTCHCVRKATTFSHLC